MTTTDRIIIASCIVAAIIIGPQIIVAAIL